MATKLTPEFIKDIKQRYRQHFSVTEIYTQLQDEGTPLSRPYIQALFSQFRAEKVQKFDRRKLA